MSKFYVILTLKKGQYTLWKVKVIPLRGHMQNILKLCWAEALLFEKLQAYEITLTKGDNECLTTINVNVFIYDLSRR